MTSSETLVGRLLDGRYRIGERIARGGMASVHVGTDERLDRVVAIKIMHRDLGDDVQFTARFVQEARSAARLNHPSVVSVFDQGEDQGLVFLVMEYVPGRTLRDVMRAETPMAPRRALTLLEQLLVALAVAHEARIVHRDVKPENVLIAPDGRVKVADFGLARAVSASTTSATTGVLIGTISYLAPELVTNEGADARTDVYACGAVLYEMLTGQKPHRGESAIQVAYKHVHEDVPPPSAVVPGIPPYLDALVARATARDRHQRSADAHVLLQQVRQTRSALDQGLADDVELTQDLTPHRLLGPLASTTLPESIETLRPAADATGDETVLVHPGRDDLDDRFDTVPRDTAPHQTLPAAASPTEVTSPVQRTPVPPPPGDRAVLPSPSSPYRPERRRRGAILLVLVIVLAVLAAIGGWYWGVGRYEQTPDLTGMAVAQATNDASGAGYALDVDRQAFSETVPAGAVISTDPSPGGKILPDDTISAVVSKGKERYAVPDLSGRSQQDAERVLADLNLEVGDREPRYSERVPRDEVIRTALDTGTQVKRGTEIDLYVSRGRRPIEVTDYVGKPAAQAVAALEDKGLEVQTRRAFDAEVPKDSVVSQDPKDGTLYKGDTVRLVVSDGAEPVDVPQVVGRSEAAARKELEKKGFEVEVDRDTSYVGLGFVVRQDPGSGGKAVPGTTVTITLV
ncbi:Stk1 family PASTA domain-containing Ser/Thr kinase [Solicola sp. PLA-1-18]|uniref:Stk1 family PASTA domain-containing Ser/Thr kinase n=1 Tax=Solicola sp. PLA-1-18 TaxID=3380532 RepID=UPI003B7C3DFE